LDPEEKNDDENEESHATLSLLCGYGSDNEWSLSGVFWNLVLYLYIMWW
jgi:hypothetical protein